MASENSFDAKAADWDARPLVKDLTMAAAEALKAEVMEPNIDILDYGCGTGLLAQALAGDAALVLGVDSSQGMIERFQQRLRAKQLSNLRCVCLELLDEHSLEAARQGRNGHQGRLSTKSQSLSCKQIVFDVQETNPFPLTFDLVMSLMTFHHIKDVAGQLRVLWRHLQPGGKIAIFDLLKTQNSLRFHKAGSHGLYHPGGFSLEEVTTYISAAGFWEVTAKPVHVFQKEPGNEYFTMFMAGRHSRHMADGSRLQEGRFYVEITPEALDLPKYTSLVEDPSAGAIATFVGVTRNHFQGKTTEKLEYEAYVPMALKKLQELCEAACSQWDLIKIAIAHRTGLVRVGEASVVIAASSAHRRDALEACHWAIDELKATVPIWKKEFFEGAEVWKENKESGRRLEQQRHGQHSSQQPQVGQQTER